MGQKEEADGLLLPLALKLREAAYQAGRGDVAGKAEEAIALLNVAEREAQSDKGNALIKFLDGLGF